MEVKYNSFEILKDKINNSLTNVTKCYILINYADNTEEEIEILEEEFKNRYSDFYKTIVEVEQILDEKYLSSDCYKKILDLDYYKDNLDCFEAEEMEFEEDLDIIYYKKTNSSNTKMNFYYNNKSEFGPSTRFHVETAKNGLINPNAKDEKERKYIFNTLVEYYNKMYKNTAKRYVKSM